MNSEIDANKIQAFYNEGNTWNDVKKNFNINDYRLAKLVKEGKFKTDKSKSLSRRVTGRKLSDETKERISKSRIKYLTENPDKVPYLLNHNSKKNTYPEKYFTKIFNKAKIIIECYYRLGRYELDFVILNKSINIEIDGDQHHLDKRIIKSDQRRDEYLSKNGWEVIRIKWSDYQKQTRENKKKFIKDLFAYIDSKLSQKPELIFINRTTCLCGSKKDKTATRCRQCTNILKSENALKVIGTEKIPTIEALGRLVWEVPITTIAKSFGVSGNCIIKKCKKLGINRPKRGYWNKEFSKSQVDGFKGIFKDWVDNLITSTSLVIDH